jgi:hypothetical protein
MRVRVRVKLVRVRVRLGLRLGLGLRSGLGFGGGGGAQGDKGTKAKRQFGKKDERHEQGPNTVARETGDKDEILEWIHQLLQDKHSTIFHLLCVDFLCVLQPSFTRR